MYSTVGVCLAFEGYTCISTLLTCWRIFSEPACPVILIVNVKPVCIIILNGGMQCHAYQSHLESPCFMTHYLLISKVIMYNELWGKNDGL